MRILLATEGESDEIVATRLIARLEPMAVVVCKKYAHRGYPAVRRSVATLVRAGHYQLYDALVIHFDLDDTLPDGYRRISESQRWQEVSDLATNTQNQLGEVPRNHPLQIVRMAPRESTEAWLAWGKHNEDGGQWERKNRHSLKRALFGDPPRGIIEKSRPLTESLLALMDNNDSWPPSLRCFVELLDTINVT